MEPNGRAMKAMIGFKSRGVGGVGVPGVGGGAGEPGSRGAEVPGCRGGGVPFCRSAIISYLSYRMNNRAINRGSIQSVVNSEDHSCCLTRISRDARTTHSISTIRPL